MRPQRRDSHSMFRALTRRVTRRCSIITAAVLLSLTLLTPSPAQREKARGPVRLGAETPTILRERSGPAQRTRQPASNAERFDQVWRTVGERFYDPKMRGLDWKAVGARYRARASAAASKHEFQAVVKEMLGELRASHLDYFTDDDMEFYLLQSVFAGNLRGLDVEHIGVTGTHQNGAFVVGAVLNDGPAARAGIRVGDRLLTADGKPFRSAGSFRGRAGGVVEIVLDRPGAAQRAVNVKPVKQAPQAAFLEATRKSVRIVERGGKRLGYIHLWCMTDAAFERAFTEALGTTLAKTNGLILDLRDGFGGKPHEFADHLFRPDIDWVTIPRSGKAQPWRTGYNKPLVVLINGGTRSAKEFFAYQIKKSGRGTLVGTTTAGAFIGAGGYRIGSDGFLEVPLVDLTLDGKRLEGVGVPPDVRVEAHDTYDPGDRQVQRGIEVLLGKLPPSGNFARRVE